MELEPELTVLQGGTPWLRLRISDGGRPYVVKSLEELLSHIENNQVVSYGKSLAFQHRWDAFTPEARQLLNLLRLYHEPLRGDRPGRRHHTDGRDL